MEHATRVAVTAVVVVLVIGGALGAWLAAPLLLVLFGGVLMAVALRGLSDLVSRVTRLDEGPALALVVTALAASVVGAGVLVAPAVLAQVEELATKLPAAVQSVERKLWQTRWFPLMVAGMRDPGVRGEIEAASGTGLYGFAETVAGTLVSGVGALILVVVTGIYLAAQPSLYRDGALSLLPPRQRPRARAVADEMARQLRWWLVGQVSAMSVVGVLTTAGLWALGVPLALALGVLAGALSFVPNFGPLVSAGVAALVAVGPDRVPHVLALFALVQAFESYVSTPLIQRRAVDLPPVTLIASQVILGALLGFPGLVAAAPLVVVGRVALQRLYREDLLGDPSPGGRGAVPGKIGITSGFQGPGDS